jgi:hypothetical protein
MRLHKLHQFKQHRNSASNNGGVTAVGGCQTERVNNFMNSLTPVKTHQYESALMVNNKSSPPATSVK